MADRVSWEARAEYLQVLQDLGLSLNREKDAVQVGGQETIAFGYVLSGAVQAREKYRCRVAEAAESARELEAKQATKRARALKVLKTA